jgi:hypothetical protein
MSTDVSIKGMQAAQNGWNPRLLSRRQMLGQFGGGLAGIAFAWLSARDLRASNPLQFDLLPKTPHFKPRARNIIFLYMGGGPSQMDLFDPKPALNKYDGQPIPFSITQRAVRGTTKLMASPFKFSRHGRSGIELSELLPGFAEVVDEAAIVRSGVTTRIDHGEALLMMHTGRPISGFPSLGCWVTYGLGTANDSMPAYVALPDTDPERLRNAISSGWLPALYQGTPLNIKGSPIFDLERPAGISSADQRDYLQLTQALNRRHQVARRELTQLDARIQNFELAARMQVEALRSMNLTGESESTKKSYGLDNEVTQKFGTQCLIARRLVESGVRFVHLIRNDWDHHGQLKEKLAKSCAETDGPVAALIKDLKQRGLLDSTLVIWAGEFGRLPVAEGGSGRDHNPYGFSFWMAGGGIKGGTTYGSTDEFGYASVENKVTMADFHATVLHLLGLDFKKVTFDYEGRDESLTGVEPARVVKEILA